MSSVPSFLLVIQLQNIIHVSSDSRGRPQTIWPLTSMSHRTVLGTKGVTQSLHGRISNAKASSGSMRSRENPLVEWRGVYVSVDCLAEGHWGGSVGADFPKKDRVD